MKKLIPTILMSGALAINPLSDLLNAKEVSTQNNSNQSIFKSKLEQKMSEGNYQALSYGFDTNTKDYYVVIKTNVGTDTTFAKNLETLCEKTDLFNNITKYTIVGKDNPYHRLTQKDNLISQLRKDNKKGATKQYVSNNDTSIVETDLKGNNPENSIDSLMTEIQKYQSQIKGLEKENKSLTKDKNYFESLSESANVEFGFDKNSNSYMFSANVLPFHDKFYMLGGVGISNNNVEAKTNTNITPIGTSEEYGAAQGIWIKRVTDASQEDITTEQINKLSPMLYVGLGSNVNNNWNLNGGYFVTFDEISKLKDSYAVQDVIETNALDGSLVNQYNDRELLGSTESKDDFARGGIKAGVGWKNINASVYTQSKDDLNPTDFKNNIYGMTFGFNPVGFFHGLKDMKPVTKTDNTQYNK